MKQSLLSLTLLASLLSFGQQTIQPYSPELQQQFNELKKQGKLKGTEIMIKGNTPSSPAKIAPSNPNVQAGLCDCWLVRDSSWQIGAFDFAGGSGGPGVPPDYRNDDWSTAPITLAFNYCLYGQSFNTLHLNNNGNISFGSPYSIFSAVPFPSAQYIMVAPFWADVDTRALGSGLVYWKQTPTALYVQWEQVGYYGIHDDLLNTFQLIITDGNDPILPYGNTSFCYKDMQWTTGDASGGINGFGGTPATVGANLGDGINYIQFGLFDQAGTAYDGPGGLNDGVSWLDNQNLIFNACASGGNNVAPVPSGLGFCDTIEICAGDTTPFTMSFISPETNQTTTITATSTLPWFNIVNNIPGPSATIDLEFYSGVAGYYTVTLTATDNGTPSQTTTLTFVIHVSVFNAPLPVITGNASYCQGGTGVNLSCGPGPYTSYSWSTGATTSSITNVMAGTYTCTVGDSGCFKTATFIVTENPSPVPVVTGPAGTCGQPSVTLGVSGGPYSSYVWSTGATTSTITVGTGNYSVTVTDANGCTGTSTAFNVTLSPAPTASFLTNPPGPVIIGSSYAFTDQSTVSSGNIVSWYWTFGDGNTSTAQSPGHTYALPGTYTVCLTVSTSTPCTDSTCWIVEVRPLDVLPLNVMTPNGDNYNDFLEFKNLEYYKDNHLELYNRWGNIILDVQGYNNTWSAPDVSDGVYYYILTIPAIEKTLTGFVHILKNK